MKCFLPCFSASKRQKHFSQPANTNTNTTTTQPTLQNTNLQESIHWISESKIEIEDQSQCINNTTHDLEPKEKALKEDKTTPQDNHEQEQEEKECSESLFSVSIGCGKPVSAEENDDEIEVNSTPMKLRRSKDVSGPSSIVPLKEPKPESNEAKEESKQPLLNKYRYQDCSDDEYDDINLNEGSSESSLFSLSTDYYNNNNKRKPISVSSIGKELVDNEVTSIMVEPQEEEKSEGNNIEENDENVCSSVLNPIENVSQRKVKATLLHSVTKDKENINWNQPEPSLKLSLSSNIKMNNDETEKRKEIGVDTSLSSWLVESENKYNTPKKCDVEDRPILGALTMEEIRKYSSNISRTSSRTHSPEETPIIGSVGSYWNHSEQRKSSKSNKYGKDGKREWSSTTIKTRLEPAFEAASSINKD